METSSAGHTEGSGTVQASRRACGSLQFVGHLYCEKMLTDKIIHQLIKSLMTDVEAPRQGDIECFGQADEHCWANDGQTQGQNVPECLL